MKKSIIAFTILFLLASFVYAGPFGLEMGMTFCIGYTKLDKKIKGS